MTQVSEDEARLALLRLDDARFRGNLHDFQEAYSILSAALDQMAWKPIDETFEDERVMVAGWQPRSGTVAGYWWMYEDVIIDGKALDHPKATMFQRLPAPPKDHPHG